MISQNCPQTPLPHPVLWCPLMQAITAVDKLIMYELPKVVPDLANVAQVGCLVFVS